jgi:hypothetical protein
MNLMGRLGYDGVALSDCAQAAGQDVRQSAANAQFRTVLRRFTIVSFGAAFFIGVGRGGLFGKSFVVFVMAEPVG